MAVEEGGRLWPWPPRPPLVETASKELSMEDIWERDSSKIVSSGVKLTPKTASLPPMASTSVGKLWPELL